VPNTLIHFFKKKLVSKFISLGVQNCHYHEGYGPFTGSVNATMLKKAGAEYIILGHSENRSEGESNKLIKKKIISSLNQKLNIIFCIGETYKERQMGKTFFILKQQFKKSLDKKFGIRIIDVRIKRADLPQANSEAIYKRMQTEREREAKEFRARGAEMAVTITSTADKEVTVLLANAKKQSEIMKGEGDGQRNKIFANAFGKDPDFFSFYRAMQAYETALIGGDTSLILSPDSDFFKFFGSTGLIKNQ